MHLTWTPKGAEPLFLGVTLQDKTPLTEQAYLSRLGGRLTRMIRAAPPATRKALARRMWAHDQVDANPEDALQAADLLMETETFRMALGEASVTRWPVAPEETDPETAAEIQETALEDWMTRLYPA